MRTLLLTCSPCCSACPGPSSVSHPLNAWSVSRSLDSIQLIDCSPSTADTLGTIWLVRAETSRSTPSAGKGTRSWRVVFR
jgi:hypothetical protein